MTILSRGEKQDRKPEIDLGGPEGNVFVLMGYATKWAKQLGLEAEPIIEDMMSADYEHALEVLEKHFGEYVTFHR